jgi:Heavy metal binding domain
MSTKLLAVSLSMLLTACATHDLPLDPPSSPASAQAQESRARVPHSLAVDETTQAINARLSETKGPAEKTGSGNNIEINSDNMQGMAGMQPAASPAQPKKFYYTCVMHPQIHLDKPGKCPICGMTLIKKEGAPSK